MHSEVEVRPDKNVRSVSFGSQIIFQLANVRGDVRKYAKQRMAVCQRPSVSREKDIIISEPFLSILDYFYAKCVWCTKGALSQMLNNMYYKLTTKED